MTVPADPPATAPRPAGAAGPVVEVRHLRKEYATVIAVDDVSFSVADGEIFGILGPNGAGKTTTVECVAGLRRPDAGEIRVLGLDPRREAVLLHERVGVQLQEGALPDKLRVSEALRLYASFYHQPADGGELLGELGLAGKARDYYGKLSGGQKQRLAIALALIGQPRVVVLDELTSGLDPAARRATWGLVEGLRDRGVTVLLVTHFMDEAERLCDRVALIDSGRVAALGTPEHLAGLAGAGKRVRFTPSAPFDDDLLDGLPEVTSVTRQGEHVIVTGSGQLVNAVILTLDAAGITALDVDLEASSLEDAFLALTRGKAEGWTADAGGEPARGKRSARQRSQEPGHGGTAATATALRHLPRAAIGRLTLTEARLALREPAGLIFGLGLPVLLLIIFGSLPAFHKHAKSLGGLTAFDVYLPILIALTLAMLGLISLPIPLASYRERGVLRRLSTTPAPPTLVLGAQFAINLAMACIAICVIVFAGALAFGGNLPGSPAGFALAVVLATAALLAIGTWVAAIARSARMAGGIGSLLLYPMLFFAGLWVPREIMPAVLRDVSDYTPLGAAVGALQSSYQGSFPSAGSLLVLAGYAVAFVFLAVRRFHWE